MGSFDCKGQSAQIPYTPRFWQCWGLLGIPSTLNIRRFDIVENPGAPPGSCTDLPFTGVMQRDGCAFRWIYGDIVFGTLGVPADTGPPPLSNVVDQDDLLTSSPAWGVSAPVNTPIEAYCSQVQDPAFPLDPTKKITTFYFLTEYTTVACTGKIEITGVI